MRRLAIACMVLGASCSVEEQGVPVGKLARVGEVVLGPRDVASVSSQLGAYAQLRFAGEEGQRSLLGALVVAELLSQEAIEAGLGDDPRVEHAVLEEIAEVYLSSELERRVPYASVAADAAALQAYHDAHRTDFTTPERRSMQGVAFSSLAEADAALRRLEAGEAELEDFGNPVGTPLQARDDHEHPTFHPFLFAQGVGEGDWLPQPVMLAEAVLVGRVQSVKPPTLTPLSDPVVRERVVRAVRQPRLDAARDELLAELRERYPATPP